MIRRWDGSNWVDVSFLRRWNGSAWVDSSMNKWNGSAWQKVYPTELNLYNYGDQCFNVSGGWSMIIDLWTCYGRYSRSSERYINYNADHICIRTSNWQNNGSVRSSSAIDLTNYSKINILFDFYSYQSATYNNGFDWGVCIGPMSYFMNDQNPPTVKCSGYTYREARAIDIDYNNDQIWYNDRVHSIDISDLTGSWYVFTAPFSWSWSNDYTIVKIKRIWLS